MAEEAIPILGGMALGAMLAMGRGRLFRWTAVAVAALLAASATVASGEYRLGWSFLAVDAALVLAGAGVSMFAAHGLRLLLRSRG
jgi:hypothetical protein